MFAKSRPRHHGATLSALIVGLMAWVAALAATAQSADAPEHIVVKTTAGSLRGKVSGDGAVEVFRGVPYATPPVGELRWRAPVSDRRNQATSESA